MDNTAIGPVGAGPLEKARLTLEGLDSAVVTRVKHRGLYRMTVEQSLPFLRLSAAVRDEEGRAAHIESVAVDFDGDTPQLVLELVYDEEEPVTIVMPRSERDPGWHPKRRRDPTVSYDVPRSRARLAPDDEGARRRRGVVHGGRAPERSGGDSHTAKAKARRRDPTVSYAAARATNTNPRELVVVDEQPVDLALVAGPGWWSRVLTVCARALTFAGLA